MAIPDNAIQYKKNYYTIQVYFRYLVPGVDYFGRNTTPVQLVTLIEFHISKFDHRFIYNSIALLMSFSNKYRIHFRGNVDEFRNTGNKLNIDLDFFRPPIKGNVNETIFHINFIRGVKTNHISNSTKKYKRIVSHTYSLKKKMELLEKEINMIYKFTTKKSN
jgi:hypothetical protein